MKRILFVALGVGGLSLSVAAQETVVLVHGIVNRPIVMTYLEKSLENAGFRVLNWGYPSTDKTIEEFSSDFKGFMESQSFDGPVHFVGFSLGTIVLRDYLSRAPSAAAGRFVQIAPPNHGSTMVDKFSDWEAFHWIFGEKAIQELKPDSEFMKSLGLPRTKFGIIVGGKGDGEGYNGVLSGDDDGAVSLESSRLEGAHDWIQVGGRHTPLLFKPDTARQTIAFLRTGKFEHETQGRKWPWD